MRRDGFTLIELMIVVAVIAVIAAMAIPSLQAARRSANEANTIGFLRMAVTVNEQYRTRFGRYPTADTDLFNSGFVDPGQNPAGYTLTFNTTPFTWALNADPDTMGQTGDRGFFVDQTGVIRNELGAVASSMSAPVD